MIMYDQDPDILRWGLDILHVEPFSNSAYCGTTAQEDACFYDGGYARGEATGPSHASEEHSQESVLAQEWVMPSMRNFYSGNGGGQEEIGDMESNTSSSSPGEVSYEWEELEFYDKFSTLDCELGKRLNQMVSIPHVPRINGEIPSVDEATSDHQRLLDRLQLYDLVELKVQGDGNCQFRALSDQFYRTPEHHEFVRQQVISQLKSHPENYEGYVPMAYGDYLKKLSKYFLVFKLHELLKYQRIFFNTLFLLFILVLNRSGEWGDHVTLQAAADFYGVKIFVITSFKDTCYIEILPNEQRSKRVIFLSFWAEVHYNSIYPEGDQPSSDIKRKKWWHFGNKH